MSALRPAIQPPPCARRRRWLPALIMVVAAGAAAPAAAGADEPYKASCSVNPSGPMVSIRPGDPVSITMDFANYSNNDVGFTVRREANWYAPRPQTTGVLVRGGQAVQRHYDLATERLPVGVMQFEYGISAGRPVAHVGDCHFTLEVLPTTTPRFQWFAFGPLLPSDEIVLPVKWCAVEGSDAAELDAHTRDEELFALTALASDIFQRNGAGIDFRGHMLRLIALEFDQPDYPVIADPRPPGDGGLGPLGAMDVSSYNGEFALATRACGDAWAALESEWQIKADGVLAIRVTALLNAGLAVAAPSAARRPRTAPAPTRRGSSRTGASS